MIEKIKQAFVKAEIQRGELIFVERAIELDGKTYEGTEGFSVVRNERDADSHPYGIYVHGENGEHWFRSVDEAIEFAMTL